MQALILAGGEGTRLRPLTSTIPKPAVPLVQRPFISYMLQWLRGHGVDQAILSCGFMAGGVRAVLGDGSDLGVRLQYVEEPRPLGTGGALKYAEDLLDDRFFVLNGDVLTDVDLTAQLRQHERTGARVTLGLIAVEDPSAYGLVRRNGDGSVSEFLEKPSPDEIDTNLISLGAYVVEREVFPDLVGNGLFGFEADGYWLDIGTPQRYLQATYDILEGSVRTEIGDELARSGGVLQESSEVAGSVHAPALVGAGCVVSAGASVGGRTVLGPDVRIEAGAHINSSVLLEGCTVGSGSRISEAILGRRVTICEHCRIDPGVLIGDDVR